MKSIEATTVFHPQTLMELRQLGYEINSEDEASRFIEDAIENMLHPQSDVGMALQLGVLRPA